MSGPGIAAEEQLRAHFAGKRDGERADRRLPVEVHGEGLAFPARTVDISRSGVLFELRGEEVACGDPDRLLEAHLAIERRFRQGVSLVFGGGALRLHAELVRVTVAPPMDEGRLLLGCRFRRRLSREQCAVLGVERDGDAS